MLFAILTLFPEALEAYTRSSILGIAGDKGLVSVRLVDFRDFTRDRHRTVDDRPYGGGPGMVLKPEPIVECVEWLEREHGPFRKVLLTPGGKRFDVALIVAGKTFKGSKLRAGGRLADIAPTALAILGLEQPAEMTGEPLLNRI